MLFRSNDTATTEIYTTLDTLSLHDALPIAVGEVFNSIWDCQQLITEQLIDYIRTTVVHAGGITHLRRIFAKLAVSSRAEMVARLLADHDYSPLVAPEE